MLMIGRHIRHRPGRQPRSMSINGHVQSSSLHQNHFLMNMFVWRMGFLARTQFSQVHLDRKARVRLAIQNRASLILPIDANRQVFINEDSNRQYFLRRRLRASSRGNQPREQPT